MCSLGLLGLVLLLLAVTAVASPWLALGLGGLGAHFEFSRVFNRVFEGLLVVAIGGTWRGLDLGKATQIGLRRRDWPRQFDIRRTPVWLIGPGWPPLVGGVGRLVALPATGVLLAVALRRLLARERAPTVVT